jgi:hypothetical protein
MIRVEQIDNLQAVDGAAWNRLAGEAQPFLRHEFLAGLERHGCLRGHGWSPLHLVATAPDGQIQGAMPLYLKDNSYGEFVFDWSWAEAYERAGGRYYPKLVSAVPFTPVSGPRLLIDPQADAQAVTAALIDAGRKLCERHGLSSFNCLFPDETQAQAMAARGGLLRIGCQYHWENPGYRDFQDFLDRLNAKHRKQIRRERREVAESGIEIETLAGADISDEVWRIYHGFYCSTFDRKWGEPRLTLDFFRSLSQTMPEQTLLFMARYEGRYVAGAFALRGTDTLYGRHWGCSEFHRHLHFEVCYYRTIDYCIRHGLKRLDAGAQGEHKLARGFRPVRTWSVHWLSDPGFRRAVAEFLDRETAAIEHYIQQLAAESPYRRADAG